MSIEAMKLALEALENASPSAWASRVDSDTMKSIWRKHAEALEGLQVLLAELDNASCKSVQKRLEAQQLATPEPDEWKLVPIVPTEKMLLAYTGGAVTNAGFRWCRHQWSAMLAAAPAAHPAPSVPDDVVRDAERFRRLNLTEEAIAVVDSMLAA